MTESSKGVRQHKIRRNGDSNVLMKMKGERRAERKKKSEEEKQNGKSTGRE